MEIGEIIKVLESTSAKPSMRALVSGVGINDAPFQTSKRIKGKLYNHPAYLDWFGMIQRCYSGKQKAYAECYVAEEWRSFSNFYEWWKIHHKLEWALDKDLLGDGKLYSPNTCCYIPQYVNNLIMGLKTNPYKRLGIRKGATQVRYTFDYNIDGRKYHILFKDIESFDKYWNENLLERLMQQDFIKELPLNVQEKLEKILTYSDILCEES